MDRLVRVCFGVYLKGPRAQILGRQVRKLYERHGAWQVGPSGYISNQMYFHGFPASEI